MHKNKNTLQGIVDKTNIKYYPLLEAVTQLITKNIQKVSRRRKSMKRRIMALLVVTTMLTTLLAGCGKQDAPAAGEKSTSEGVASSEEPVTLSIWHIENDEVRQEVFKNAIARFEADYPHITVEQVPMENDPYKTSLATSMAAGEEPDIFISWGGGWLQSFVDEGKVLDIDEKIDAVSDEYYEAALSLFELDGKNYALPYRCGPAPVYYNKAIYEEYGLEVPTTLEELEKNCEILLENGIIPFALGNSSQWPGALTFIWLSLREGGQQTFLDAYLRNEGGSFADESFVRAGEKIQEWVGKGYYPEGANGINYDTGGSRMLFYTGQTAHIIQTSSFISNCKSEAPEVYENLGLFNYPTIAGGKGQADEILGGGNGYSISASTAHPEEAFELTRYLSNKDYGQDMVDIAGLFTGVKGVEITEPLTKQVEEMVLNSSYIQNFYDQFLPTELGNLHKQTTYDLFGMSTTPEQAAADMEAQAVKDLGEAK